MSLKPQQQQQYFDLNVHLPASRHKYHANLCQIRLHQLGYNVIAFSHTAFGRLKPERDHADKALPWNDLLDSATETMDSKSIVFGRTNSLGMKIYRRLNIVIEENSDVSQLLLPSTAEAQQSARDLFQKYDIVSLLPMNENVLQSICELLSQSDAASSNNLTNTVQIINLEYATGSRGGYGLPYKLRKDYVVKVLEAGVTFELNYSTAMSDSKRRHGFVRTLVEFQSALNGIQKKHVLLNKYIDSHRHNQKCISESFPLLISSGARQNFTKGTDEGIMALRSPHDVAFLVSHLMGNSCVDTVRDKGKSKKCIISTAEKVLIKAREHSLGLITCKNEAGRTCGIKSSKTIRALVVESKGDDRDEETSEEEGNPCDSLKYWLSKPLRKKQKVDNKVRENDDKTEGERGADTQTSRVEIVASAEVKDCKHTESQAMEKTPTEEKDAGDDLEDGYIAL